jgi:hypothetical protein
MNPLLKVQHPTKPVNTNDNCNASIGDKTRSKVISFLSSCSGDEIYNILNNIMKLQDYSIISAITEYKKTLKTDINAYISRQSSREQRKSLTQQLINRYGDIILEHRYKISVEKLAQCLAEFEEQPNRPYQRLEKITPAMIRAAIKKLQEPSQYSQE